MQGLCLASTHSPKGQSGSAAGHYVGRDALDCRVIVEEDFSHYVPKASLPDELCYVVGFATAIAKEHGLHLLL